MFVLTAVFCGEFKNLNKFISAQYCSVLIAVKDLIPANYRIAGKPSRRINFIIIHQTCSCSFANA